MISMNFSQRREDRTVADSASLFGRRSSLHCTPQNQADIKSVNEWLHKVGIVSTVCATITKLGIRLLKRAELKGAQVV